jgi:hypothetical protein
VGLCDPHIHTTFSDGRHTPQQVVDTASRLAGLDDGAPTPRGRSANRPIARLDMRGKPVTGGSDAHVREMIAASCTEYSGLGPRAFREALLEVRTRPSRRRVNLLHYMRYAGAKVARHPSALRQLWPL